MPLNNLLRAACIFCLAFFASAPNCHSQDLLKVDWQRVVCTDGYIDHVCSVFIDDNGNTYTLGTFENAATCLGETVVEDSGHYFLTKQDASGAKVFAVNLGGPESFGFGDVKVCRNGDIVLGLCFKSHFFLNQTPIAYSSGWSSVIMRLDHNLNLKWFKAFSGTHNNYINKLVLDENENIYGSIQFLGSISVQNKTYSQPNGYGNAILKLNPDGAFQWSHHYYSNHTAVNECLRYDSTSGKLWLAGRVKSDYSILVDGQLQDYQVSRPNNQHYLSAIRNSGEVLRTRFLDDDISQVADIGFHQGRIFFGGAFIGVVSWDSSQLSPTDFSSICLGEVDSVCALIGFADLKSSKDFYLTGFAVSPLYGFVISGSFSGQFSLQSSAIELSNQYYVGSFLASIDDSLKLNDCRYIKGGFYNLLRLHVRDSLITGSAMFEMNCDFENLSCFAWNEDISTFQTRAIRRLSSFSPSGFLDHPYIAPPKPVNPFPIFAQIYPNPFLQSFELKFYNPVETVSIAVMNALGKVCKTVSIDRVENKVLVEAGDLAPGLYLVHCSAGNGFKAVFKLVKNGDE